MPTFCRHGRIEERCPVCAAKAKRETAAARPSSRPAAPRTPRASGAQRRTGGRPGLVVRREARAADDGFASELVPGLHATADAVRLAQEIAFATARLDELGGDPPGRYAEAALATDPEEGLWLCAQIAVLSPLEDADPWATIDAVRTTWASGELPDPGDLPLGPRSGVDPRRGAVATFEAYRAWAGRAGSQRDGYAGDAAWTPQRRFDRAFERLALPGLGRTPRFELLVLVSRLGLVELEPWSLMVGTDASDTTVLAAKRVFGIGDAVNLSRRIAALVAQTGIPAAALDLALRNWGLPPSQARIRAASTAEPDEVVLDQVLEVLGASPPGDADADPEV